MSVYSQLCLLLKGFWNLVTQGADLQNNIPNKVPSGLASLTVFALSHGVQSPVRPLSGHARHAYTEKQVPLEIAGCGEHSFSQGRHVAAS